MVRAMEMIASSQFRYSPALVPWTEPELHKLYMVWIRLHKAAWRLPNHRSFPNAQFYLPRAQGGKTITQPLVHQLQAIDIHIRSLGLWEDPIRATASKKIGCMMSDLKAASCNECALVLERLQGYHSFDVFGRFFKLCNQLHINGELPKRLLNDIPDWPSWTTLEMRFRDHWKTENCHSLQATPPAEVMSEWLLDVKHLCQQGYNSPGHLPIALHSAGSDRQAVIPPHIRAKVSALFARTVEGFHGSTSPAQDNQGKSPRSPSIPTSLQALSRNRVSIILENPSDGSYFIDNFKITTRKNAS
jgi:hypothetical protein